MFKDKKEELSRLEAELLLEAEAEANNSLDLMQKLRRQKPDIPVFIISKTNRLQEAAVAAGANGYFVLPDSEQQLLDAIQLVERREIHHDD